MTNTENDQPITCEYDAATKALKITMGTRVGYIDCSADRHRD